MHRDNPTVEKSATSAREIDRRTIAKGVAWTVPAVVIATAAPAAATSRMAASAKLTGVRFDPQPGVNAQPRLIFSGTAQSNEIGQINFLTVSQPDRQASNISLSAPLAVSSSNTFTDVTATPSVAVVPGDVTITYNYADSRNTVRGSGQLTGKIQPVSFYVANSISSTKRNGTGNVTVDFKVEITGDPDSKIAIESLSGDGGVTWSKVTAGPIALVKSGGKYYATFSADRSPKTNDSKVTVAFRIDGDTPVTVSILVGAN